MMAVARVARTGIVLGMMAIRMMVMPPRWAERELVRRMKTGIGSYGWQWQMARIAMGGESMSDVFPLLSFATDM